MIRHVLYHAIGNGIRQSQEGVEFLANKRRLWHPESMNRRKSAPATETAVESDSITLSQEVETLRLEVRVLRQAIDEVREELQYLNTNGLRLRDLDQLPHVGILKRMAADVTSKQWSERLVIDFGNQLESANGPNESHEV